ncbi:MAG: electron transfer flavoprotein subunit beta/FixA family protein [Deltaproteobacteria bacterium]|nr:electron transfer flavoprotein subunit beta/FixA family protein [Deltaproteobacteria bacterium]
MNIIVCVKQTPETVEADLTIGPTGRDVIRDDLVYTINEWDNYAIEEAIRLKETHGGQVTVVTMGGEDSEDTLRRCLAMGADEAILLSDDMFEHGDARATAQVLVQCIKGRPFDLILTGSQAADVGQGQVGLILAQKLNIPHAALVIKLEMENGAAIVHRELEGNMEEVLKIALPALLSIQTGINDPRYVSIMGIRKVRTKTIETMDAEDLDLTEAQTGESGSWTRLTRMYLPVAEKTAEIISGRPEEAAARLAEIIKNNGGLA